jgi:hypothetical protein
MLARRQLEQGDSLLQRTLRDRQTTQLRSFGGVAVVAVVDAAAVDDTVGIIARFSASESEAEELPPPPSPFLSIDFGEDSAALSACGAAWDMKG